MALYLVFGVCVLGQGGAGELYAPIQGPLTHMTRVALGKMEGESASNHLYIYFKGSKGSQCVMWRCS